MQNNQSINQSIIQISNQSKFNSTNHLAMQANVQSINTANFQVHEMNEAAEYWVHSSICIGVRRKRHLHVPHMPVYNRSVCGTATATKGVPSTVVTAAVWRRLGNFF
jgi:hypothetical protein